MTVTISTRGLEQWLNGLPEQLQAACNVEAGLIEDDIAAEAPRDTGALATSAYHVGADGSGNYGEKIDAAGALREDFRPLAEVPQPTGYATTVAVAAYYAFFQEYGTRFQPAQPFFWPALMRAQERFPRTVALMVGR